MNKLFLYIKKLNKRTTVIVALSILEITLLSVAGISYGNKNFDKYSFSSKDLLNNSMFAIMLEDSTGNYKQTESNAFPGYEYFYNNTKSGCMSSNGKLIQDSLLYDQDNKKATVKVTSSSKCYLYFDRYKETSLSDKLITSNTLWQSGLEGDGYRYVGSGAVGTETNPNNFICFGTTDVTECTTNQDKYMYRIIGVFPDENGNQHVKLIKYKQLGSYAWHSYSKTDASWENSDMYKGLNGEYFLTNSDYDYLQNNTWLNKIENWTWSAVNTQTNYGGPYYVNEISPKEIYLHEMNRSTKTNTVGNWTTPLAKIGLMYASDYTLSLGSSALALTTGTSTNRALLKTGWMHQSNNDATKNNVEWTLSHSGEFNPTGFSSWIIDSAGTVGYESAYNVKGVRPTFYLDLNVTAGYGTGTLEDPFIITDSAASSTSLKVNLSNTDSTLNISIIKGSGNLSKYCINNSTNINNCEWKKVTSNSIKYNMSSEGTYYVHVIDDQGFIANSSLKYESFRFDSSKTLAQNLIDSGWLWKSGLEDDGYRYVGSGAVGASTNPNNFICFGVSDESECINNQDKYMYRILGVFSDSNGDQHVKLIKYKQIDSGYISQYIGDSWENGYYYSIINGSDYLENSNFGYLQDADWISKIVDWNWNVVNTGDTSNDANSVDYKITSAEGIYINEMMRSETGNVCKNSNYDNIYCGSSTVNTVIAKIGLMYASDFALSVGNLGIDSTDSDLANSWLFDLEYGLASEMLISRSSTNHWFINKAESLICLTSGDDGTNMYLRPVFYLTADVQTSGGTGTIDNPYILK